MTIAESVNNERRERLAERVSAASYGTVLIIASLLVVESEDVLSGFGWELIVGVGVATWLAHIYAEILGNHVGAVDAFQPQELAKAMVDGLPIPLAAVLPALALFLGRIGVAEPRQALWIAVILAIFQLVAVGAYVGVVSDQRSRSWRYAAMAGVFGVAVVLLLVALGH